MSHVSKSRSKQRSRSMTPSRGGNINNNSRSSGTPPLVLPPAAMTPPPYLASGGRPPPSASCHDFGAGSAQLAPPPLRRSRMEHSSSAPDGYFSSHYAAAAAPAYLAPTPPPHYRAGVNTQISVTSSSSSSKGGYYRSQYSDMISEWKNELYYGRLGNGLGAGGGGGGGGAVHAATIGSHGNGYYPGFYAGAPGRGYGYDDMSPSERLGLSTARLYTFLVSSSFFVCVHVCPSVQILCPFMHACTYNAHVHVCMNRH